MTSFFAKFIGARVLTSPNTAYTIEDAHTNHVWLVTRDTAGNAHRMKVTEQELFDALRTNHWRWNSRIEIGG